MSEKQKKRVARGCLYLFVICLLVPLVVFLGLRIVGDWMAADWPEPALGVDMSPPFEIVPLIDNSTNGFFHMEAVSNLRLRWPDQLKRSLRERGQTISASY